MKKMILVFVSLMAMTSYAAETVLMKCDLELSDDIVHLNVTKNEQGELKGTFQVIGAEAQVFDVRLTTMQGESFSKPFVSYMAELTNIPVESIASIKLARFEYSNYSLLQLKNSENQEVAVVFNLDQGFVGCKK